MCFALSAKFLLFPLMTCISNGSTPQFGDIMRCFCGFGFWLRARCVNLKDYFTLWTPFVESVLKCLWIAIATDTIARGHNVYGRFFFHALASAIIQTYTLYFPYFFLQIFFCHYYNQSWTCAYACALAHTHLHNEKPFFTSFISSFFFQVRNENDETNNQPKPKQIMLRALNANLLPLSFLHNVHVLSAIFFY